MRGISLSEEREDAETWLSVMAHKVFEFCLGHTRLAIRWESVTTIQFIRVRATLYAPYRLPIPSWRCEKPFLNAVTSAQRPGTTYAA